MFTAGSGAEVGPGDQDGRALEPGVVQHEVRVLPPLVEQERAEPGSLDPLQILRWDDLVGIDVGAVERHGGSLDARDGLHGYRSSGVVKCPAIAVAAATLGLTRCVRPPLP